MHHDHSKMHSAAGGEASGHAGHAGHDHGGHGGHSGHSMSFHFSTQSTILFDWWTTSNPTEMFFACIIVFGAAYLFEWLAEYRRSMDRDLARAKTKEPKGAAPALVSDDMQLRRSASYALSMLISYLLSGLTVLRSGREERSDPQPR